MLDCPNHPGVAAAEACAGCGRALCERCLLHLRGLAWCEPCKAGPRFAEALGGRPPTTAPSAPAGPPAQGTSPLARRVIVGTLLALLLGCAVTGWIVLRRVSTKVRGAVEPGMEKACRRDLEKLGRAALAYERAKGRLPERAPGESAGDVIRRLAAEGYLRYDKSAPSGIPHAGCPGVIFRGYLPIVGTDSGRSIEDASYEGWGGGAALPYEGPVAPLAWDRDAGNHGGRGRNVLFEDGTVRWIPEGLPVTSAKVYPMVEREDE